MGTKETYIVNVGNIGNIKKTNKKEAIRTFNEYVRQSKSNHGLAGGEDVVLFGNNGEVIKEYFGTLNDQEQEK